MALDAGSLTSALENPLQSKAVGIASSIAWITFQAILYLGILGGIVWLVYRRFFMYNIHITVKEGGFNNSLLVYHTKGYVAAKDNYMRVMGTKMTLPPPERKFLTGRKKGKGWHVEMFQFGPKDFTYLEPKISEHGVELVPTESLMREWATQEHKRQADKLKRTKWFENPFIIMTTVFLFILIMLFIVMGKFEAVANACAPVASACTNAGAQCSDAISQSGRFFQN